MTQPTFNLWTEPWITVETEDGDTMLASIYDLLLNAHKYRDIYDPSPLVIVGIHRLLTAIVQDIYDPQHEEEIVILWKQGQFAIKKLEQFGASYADRFDLFSENYPFMQSADLPLQWSKGEKPVPKTVASLLPNKPSGSYVTHYEHGNEKDLCLTAVELAKGLVVIPAFATAGGQGIKRSINGDPPIYIIPGGKSTFESLVLSLIISTRQPNVRNTTTDLVWWKRDPFVLEKAEISRVGYLHSLTFPARRIRFHPIQINGAPSLSGVSNSWGARTMIFQMGESRPKDASFWFDPFAAYRLPDPKSKSKKPKLPTPVRPVDGRQLWREFASLFLQDREQRTQRPAVLKQLSYLIDEYGLVDGTIAHPFRCIGLRIDNAKVFEWIDTGFSVPPTLLSDPEVGYLVQQSISFATECAGKISTAFRQMFGGSRKDERNKKQKQQMVDAFWRELTVPFRQYVITLVNVDQREQQETDWLDTVVATGLKVFQDAAKQVGTGAHTLRQSVEGENRCRAALYKVRKDWKGA